MFFPCIFFRSRKGNGKDILGGQAKTKIAEAISNSVRNRLFLQLKVQLVYEN